MKTILKGCLVLVLMVMLSACSNEKDVSRNDQLETKHMERGAKGKIKENLSQMVSGQSEDKKISYLFENPNAIKNVVLGDKYFLLFDAAYDITTNKNFQYAQSSRVAKVQEVNLNIDDASAKLELLQAGLTEEEIKRLNDLGYSNAALAVQFNVMSVEEREFMIQVFEGNYGKAFEMDADKLGDIGSLLLVDYLTKLMDTKDMDALEGILNEISMSEDGPYNNSNERKYLDKLIIASSFTISNGIEAILASDDGSLPISEQLKILCDQNEKMMDIYSMLMGIDYLTLEPSICPGGVLVHNSLYSPKSSGDLGITNNVLFGVKIRNLAFNKGTGFSYGLKYKLGASSSQGQYFLYDGDTTRNSQQPWLDNWNTDVINDKRGEISQEYRDHLRELAKQKEAAFENFFVNAEIGVAMLYNPAFGLLKITQVIVVDGKSANAASEALDQAKTGWNWKGLENHADLDGYCKDFLGKLFVTAGIVQDTMSLSNTPSSIEDKKNNARYEIILKLLGQDSITVKGKDGNVSIVSIKGDGERALLIKRWEENGISAIMPSLPQEKIDDFEDKCSNENIKSSYSSIVENNYRNLDDADNKERYKKVKAMVDCIVSGGDMSFTDFENPEDIDLFVDALSIVNNIYHSIDGVSNTSSIIGEFNMTLGEMNE